MGTSDHVRIVKRYTVGDMFVNQLTVSPRAGRKTKRIVAALVKNSMLLCGANTTVKHEVLDFSKKELLMAIMSANSSIRQQLGAGGETLLVGFDVYSELNHILASDPYRVLAFESAYRRSSDMKIVGLKVKLVPTMSGWLVLPPESSEVYV